MDSPGYMNYTDRRLRNSLTPSRSNDLFANLGKNIMNQPYQSPNSYQGSPAKANPFQRPGYSDQFLANYNQQEGFQVDYSNQQEYRKNLNNKLANIRNNNLDSGRGTNTKSLPALQKNIFDNIPPSPAVNAKIGSFESRPRYQRQNPPPPQIQNPVQFQPEPEWNPQPFPMYPPPNYFQSPLYGGYPNLYGGGSYGQPSQQNSDPELKYQFERQNSLLEKLNRKMESRPKQSHYNNDLRASENFTKKIQELERANEIKMKLFNQQQMIQNLTLKKTAPSYMQPLFPERNTSPLFQNPGPDHRDDIIAFQNSLINNLVMPEDFVQTLLERAAPNPYYVPPYMMNQQYYPPPPEHHRRRRDSDKKKKSKKSKKNRKSTPDSSVASEPDDDDDDNKKKSSTKHHDDNKKTQPQKKNNDDDQRRDSKQAITPPKQTSKRKSTLDNSNDSEPNGDIEDDQEQQKLLEQRKKNAKRNLKIALWSSVYPIFLNLEVIEKVDQRKKNQTDDLLKNDEVTEKELVTWIHTLTQKGFDLIFDEKNKNYDFVGSPEGGRPINSDIKSRSTNVKEVVKTIVDNLFNNTKTQSPKEENLNYLAALTLGELYAFNNKFSSFEIDRINFNSYGRFMNLSREQSGMIVICTLLIRMLIYQLLLSAKEWHDQIQWTDRLPTNLKIVASVIYRIAMNWINEKVKPVNPEGASSEEGKKPVIPMPPLKASENVEITPELEKSEVILGLYTSEDLRIILEDKKWVDPIQSLIVNWAAGMYFKLVEHRKANPKKEYK